MIAAAGAGVLGTWIVRSARPPALGSKTVSAKAQADLVEIGEAIEAFATLNAGSVPDELELLVRPDENGASYLRWTRVPLDPWKRPYQYSAPDVGGDYELRTLGRDGTPGGAGLDRDLDIAWARGE